MCTTPLRPSRGPTIRCPAAYNAPVVSTMTSCINDVNSAAKFREADENGDPRAALSFEGVTSLRCPLGDLGEPLPTSKATRMKAGG